MKIEVIGEILKNIAYLSATIFGIGFIINFTIAFLYRREEERIYMEWENEANKIKSQAVAMPVINGRLKILEDKYKPLIEKIERKKQFLRDIMPLIKK